jgi:hypothetical protein
MTTENTVTTTMYDKISDPMAAISQMGEWISKSGLFGCEKVEQGMVLAMASYSERRPITDICRRFHIVKGKLAMKAEAMLAEFNQRGGKHVWVKSDDKVATLRLSYDQFKDFEVSFTIKDAERAGLCGTEGAMNKGQNGPGSWQKMPDAMLRARVTSKAIRMVCPEIVAGVYTPEEVNDEIRPTAHVETRSLLSSAPAPTTPAPAIEAEVVPPAKTLHEELKDLLAEIGKDSVEWLIAKKWIREDQPTDELPVEKVKELLARKSQFKQAVKTFAELRDKKEKKNV